MEAIIAPEQITQANVVEALRSLSVAFIQDHESLKSVQKELAEGDKKLLEKMDSGFKGLRTEIHELKTELTEFKEGTNDRLSKLEVGLKGVTTSITQLKDSVVAEQQETNALLRELIAKQ